METLLDDTPEPAALRVWGTRLGIGAGLALLVTGIAWFAHAMVNTSTGPARQVARIAILPDTPPPPPPKEERKPDPPKVEPKTVQMEQPKPVDAPAPPTEQLKMEGPVGDGPSVFAVGEVRNEYKGGEPGPAIGDGRTRFNAFAGQFGQQVRDALSRRRIDAKSLQIYVWLEPDGAIRRYQVAGVAANPELLREIEGAFAELRRSRDMPPTDMPMPVGLQISLR